jgi:hypothetical protein
MLVPMMKRTLCVLAVVATTVLAPSNVSSAPTAQEGMKSVQYLVGTWRCAHTVGDFSGTYTETFANALDGRWLRQTYEFPATNSEPAVRAEYFFEYDQRVPRWVRFGAHSNGQYYGMYSKSAGTAEWVWNYVLPSSGASPATWTKKSDAEYTIDGPSYPENGRTVTEHHTCKKAP